MTVDFKAKQHEFTQYIRNPQANPLPADVEPERMAMYRTLIFNNIDGFLAGNFPVIRALLTDTQWYELIQDFFVNHRAKTPYFAEIAGEFLEYLEHERKNPDDFPFLLELAHYEWVEMALSISSEIAVTNSPDVRLDLARQLSLSPLAWPLIYRFPVQMISPDFIPIESPEQPTSLVVYRDPNDEIKFSVINLMTYRLLEIIQAEHPQTAGDCLQQIASESPQVNPDLILTGGLQIIQELVEKSVILVC